MARRGWGDDAIYWVARRRRYVGAASFGYGSDGKRVRKVVSGKTKQEVKDKLKALHEALSRPVRSSRDYTLGLAVEDWLREGMTGRSAQTVAKYRNVLKPVLREIGNKVLADLTAADVRAALARFARTHSTDTVSIARLGLERSIRHAEADDLADRNVAALVDTPRGQAGRTSKALSLEQAAALLRVSCQERTMREFPGSPPRPPSLMHATLSCACWSGSAPRRLGRCAGTTLTWTASQMAIRLYRRTWRSGGRCGLMATRRPRSPDARSRCPGWPSPPCEIIVNVSSPTAWRLVNCGRSAGWSSLPRSAPRWMRRTSGACSRTCAQSRVWEITGRRASSVPRSYR